jgi:hypothetical protein
VGERVWTAAELEALSPAEQDALFEAVTSIVRDLAMAPPGLLARVRARIEARIAGRDLRSAS